MTNAIYDYALNDGSPMARDFLRRMIPMFPNFTEEARIEHFSKIRKGDEALVSSRDVLVLHLSLAKHIFGNFADLHISRTGGWDLPIFLCVGNNIDTKVEKTFNKM